MAEMVEEAVFRAFWERRSCFKWQAWKFSSLTRTLIRTFSFDAFQKNPTPSSFQKPAHQARQVCCGFLGHMHILIERENKVLNQLT
jgi:hypothetical protein